MNPKLPTNLGNIPILPYLQAVLRQCFLGFRAPFIPGDILSNAGQVGAFGVLELFTTCSYLDGGVSFFGGLLYLQDSVPVCVKYSDGLKYAPFIPPLCHSDFEDRRPGREVDLPNLWEGGSQDFIISGVGGGGRGEARRRKERERVAPLLIVIWEGTLDRKEVILIKVDRDIERESLGVCKDAYCVSGAFDDVRGMRLEYDGEDEVDHSVDI
eukprot:CAMPEP_0118658328 /NCGR_PEP_ID=MMETSP0785-20121206/14509_1 /TAXON_ID=91992 /ORGANISM="Bolidomonas pacifica, Strain CCMP 1866" /LENGTH=211 /DNA_ID=CAMNT_0006551337 /DNA_START=522 /DNA_END=1155 /DNA_ORIENTATION=+